MHVENRRRRNTVDIAFHCRNQIAHDVDDFRLQAENLSDPHIRIEFK